MEKIRWDFEKDRDFLKDAKSIIICNHCGWLIKDPEKSESMCNCCGKTFQETNSNIPKTR